MYRDYLEINALYHHGIKGQKRGVRRFQNEDGTLTEAGRARYGVWSEYEKNKLESERSSNELEKEKIASQERIKMGKMTTQVTLKEIGLDKKISSDETKAKMKKYAAVGTAVVLSVFALAGAARAISRGVSKTAQMDIKKRPSNIYNAPVTRTTNKTTTTNVSGNLTNTTYNNREILQEVKGAFNRVIAKPKTTTSNGNIRNR